MSWKLRGMSTLRRSFNDYLQKLKSKQVMSTWQQCDNKKATESLDCCPQKSLFDEATVPEGSWSENFNRHDTVSNQILVSGIVFFTIGAVVFYKVGYIKGHPNSPVFWW